MYSMEPGELWLIMITALPPIVTYRKYYTEYSILCHPVYGEVFGYLLGELCCDDLDTMPLKHQ